MSAGNDVSGSQVRAVWGLCAISFFIADVQGGTGPFLGVFLQKHGWAPGVIGSVMTAGGLGGMLATIPAGAFVDHTRWKRLAVIFAAVCAALASLLVLVSQTVVVVTVSQVVTAVAGAFFGPAVTGMTLGVVRQSGFALQNGRNQAWNHAGNVVGAGLSGLLGWQFGLSAIFVLMAVFGVLAVLSVLIVPESAIDHKAARGVEGDDQGGEGWVKVFLRQKSLLVLALALCCFHLGNGAMLPLYGQAVVGAGKGNSAIFTALTVVVAQAVMVVASLVTTRVSMRRGYWLVLLISFLSLPVRGFLAGSVIQEWGVWPVQALDGIGAGLQSVAVPGLVARLLAGTGRVNVGQGAVMTAQAVGASLSPAIGGWLAQGLGYGMAFRLLGCFAVGSLVLWVGFSKMVRQAEENAVG